MENFGGPEQPILAAVVEDESTWSWSRAKLGWFPQFIGFASLFASLFSNSYIFDSARLLILGSIIETGRRLCQWLFERFRFQYSITAQFDEGDPAYEWIVHFLTQENVWRRSRDFRVSARNSKRKWAVSTGPSEMRNGNAEYVPTYELPQLFRWKGYWLEIKRSRTMTMPSQFGCQAAGTIFVSIYTLDMSVLSELVEEARLRYIEVSKPDVIIHMVDTPHYSPAFAWTNVKRKVRRPLSSIILQQGVIQSLVQDAQEFIDMESWYIERGIPHRRGYLLHGPPGSGKSSTIYALAGELGLEIYSLSLASGFVDDSFLQRAASSIPKHSIFLIEDIDCAFPSREDADNEQVNFMAGYHSVMNPPFIPTRRSSVTLSGLLNVIDGVGSEEGKLFFATTNYIDHLDPALLRPGRIDKKVQYSLATKEQAAALFERFFPDPSNSSFSIGTDKPIVSVTADRTPTTSDSDKTSIQELSQAFASFIPPDEFSTAELQGYLLGCKKQPESAVSGVQAWIEREREDRKERREREEVNRRKAKAKRDSLAKIYSSPLPPPFSSGAAHSLPPPTTVGPPTTAMRVGDEQSLPSPAYEPST